MLLSQHIHDDKLINLCSSVLIPPQLAVVAIELRKLSEALAYFDRAIDIDPNHQVSVHVLPPYIDLVSHY